MDEEWQLLIDGTAFPFGTYGLTITAMAGAGMAPISNIASPYARRPGAYYQRTKVQPRSLVLQGVVTGTVGALHAARRALVARIAPRDPTTPTPLTLRYTGASIPLTMRVVYESGLEGQFTDRNREVLALRLFGADPFWSGTTQTAALAGSVLSTISATLLQRTPDGVWGTVLPGTISALAPYQRGVVLGGSAILYAGTSGVISVLGTITMPSTQLVTALAVGPDGTALIAAGAFTAINGVSAAQIARYTGTTWQALSSGLPTPARALLYGHDGNLYAAGSFEIPVGGGGSARHLARWTGVAWQAVGTMPNAPVSALLWANGGLFAGGEFTAIGTTPANRVARWDGTVWAALGPGLDGPVLALVADGAGNVVAGGTFTATAGGSTPLAQVGMWDGAIWRAMANGLSRAEGTAQVRSLWRERDGGVVAVGAFNRTGQRVLPEPLARWSGQAWFPASIDTPALSLRQGAVTSEGTTYVLTETPVTSLLRDSITTVQTGGTTATAPTLVVTGPGRLLQLVNLTTGAALYFDLDLLLGETVTIDLGRKVFTSTLQGNILRTILPGSTITGWTLQPGANRVSLLYIPEPGPTTPTATLTWTDTYWSVDV